MKPNTSRFRRRGSKSNTNTMDEEPPNNDIPKTILDESDVSRDVSLAIISQLGDSNRSGDIDLSARLHHHDGGRHMPLSHISIQEEQKMDNQSLSHCQQYAAGERIPVATPASAEDARTNISARLASSTVPPLPMGMNHISPATPMLPQVPVSSSGSMSGSNAANAAANARANMTSPVSTHSQDSRASALAMLYQSSRRSRNNTPQSTSVTSMPPPLRFPPPPPLFTPGTESASQQQQSSSAAMPPSQQLHLPSSGRGEGSAPQQTGLGASSISNDNNIHNISLQSSGLNASGLASSGLHDSWNTSMSSLMNTSSFLNSSFNNASMRGSVMYNPRLSGLGGSVPQGGGYAAPSTIQGQASQGSIPQGSAAQGCQAMSSPAQAQPQATATMSRPQAQTTGERLRHSGPPAAMQFNRPNLMDYKMEDVSNRRLSDGTASTSKGSQRREQQRGGGGERSISGGSSSIGSSRLNYRIDELQEQQHRQELASRDSMEELVGLHNRWKARPNLMNYKLEDRQEGGEQQEQAEQDHQDEEGEGDRKMPTVPTLSGEATLSGDSSSHLSLAHQEHPQAAAERPSTSSPSVLRGMEHKLSTLQVGSKRDLFESMKGGSESGMEDLDGKGEGDTNKDKGSGSTSNQDGMDEDAKLGTEDQPKKKRLRASVLSVNQQMADDYLTPVTHKTTMSSASFDIMAYPSSRVSELGYDASPHHPPLGTVDMSQLLKSDENVPNFFEVNAQADHDGVAMGEAGTKGGGLEESQESSKIPQVLQAVPQELQPTKKQPTKQIEGPSEKEQRILRRKVQRLLLIRHCSTCNFIPPPLVTIPKTIGVTTPDETANEDEDTNVPQAPTPPSPVCPVTSHCAEGKRLCAHIRTCKSENCSYKKCLTSREVLGHYKNCRDRACEICGPVRALDRKRRVADNVGHHDRDGTRKNDDSSIETIDDEGWLVANMIPSPGR